MLVPQVVEGEGSGQPSEPQPPPSTAPPSQEGQVSAVAPSHPQKTQTPRQAKRGRDTEIPQSGGPPEKVGDEVVHKELGDRVERAATTAASLDAEQDSGNILKTQSTAIPNTRSERVPTPSYDSPLLGGNTPRSDEERLEQHELMDNVPPTPHDSPLLGGHTPGSDEGRPNINELMLKKKVKRLEKKQRARTSGMKLFKNGTSKRKSLEKENVSKQGRNLKTRPMFEEGDFDDDFDDIDDMVNEATENVKRDTVNTGTTGVSAASASVTTGDVSISIAEPRTPPTTTTTAFEDEDLYIIAPNTCKRIEVKRIRKKEKELLSELHKKNLLDQQEFYKGKGIMQEPEKSPKNPIKAQIQRDAEIAQRLFEEEQAQFKREQRIARERAAEQEAKDATLIEQMEDIQARMDANDLLAERLQQEEREQFTIEEKSRMLVEMIAERKRFFAAERAEQIRNKPPTKTQLRNKMVTYLKHMGKYTHNQMKSRSFEEIQKLYEKEQKWINDFVHMDSKVVKDGRKGKAEGGRKKTVARKRTCEKLDDESVKRQKIEDDAEKEELRAYLDIIPEIMKL
ncbi:hypothetical protein Tco_0482023 [Tanacetum coccineum]